MAQMSHKNVQKLFFKAHLGNSEKDVVEFGL